MLKDLRRSARAACTAGGSISANTRFQRTSATPRRSARVLVPQRTAHTSASAKDLRPLGSATLRVCPRGAHDSIRPPPIPSDENKTHSFGLPRRPCFVISMPALSAALKAFSSRAYLAVDHRERTAHMIQAVHMVKCGVCQRRTRMVDWLGMVASVLTEAGVVNVQRCRK